MLEPTKHKEHPITQLANAIWAKQGKELPFTKLQDRLDAILAAHEIKAYTLVEQLLHRFELSHCPRCLVALSDRDREVRETVGEMCVRCYNTWLINAHLEDA